MAAKKTKAVRLEIKGLKETQRKMEQVVRDLKGEPMLQGLRKATLLVERHAKINAPVDTGRLRASITPEIATRDTVVQGIVGSNVVYAPFQEKKKKYLYRALIENKQRIYQILADVVAKIVTKEED